VRDPFAVRRAVRNASAVFHFAAQTAVTTSLSTPKHDFDINALGTVTLLEELRLLRDPIPLVFTSTNKVYGDLDRLALRLQGSRWMPQHPDVAGYGIDETWPLQFRSPYGCSKGAADQYVLDYARSYGLPNVVLRMSCIYGPHQCGNEDQGWVAHFVIRALQGLPVTIFGDGCQVRDVLFVDDLVDALLLASSNAGRLSGMAFNIGGGPRHTTSLLELLDLIEGIDGQRPQFSLRDWRTGDQRYYVSDIRRFQQATGWTPRTSVRIGVGSLYRWIAESELVQPAAALQGDAA
jgi:CDP-paratose 2-epimerase